MSRYRLKPAQQLQRQVLRISRNHDEAAAEVAEKIRSMQENIAPFVHELHERGWAADAAPPSRMTPCFASRVPTGRLPGGAAGGLLDAHGGALASPGWPAEAPREPRGAGASGAPRGGSAEPELGVALARPGPAACSAEGAPRYKFLRRARCDRQAFAEPSRLYQPAPAPHAALGSAPGAEAAEEHPCWRAPDLELSRIEDEAADLVAQLAWWRRQREPDEAGGPGTTGDAAEAPAEEEEGEELASRSEWLRLPSDGVAAATVPAPEEEGGAAPRPAWQLEAAAAAAAALPLPGAGARAPAGAAPPGAAAAADERAAGGWAETGDAGPQGAREEGGGGEGAPGHAEGGPAAAAADGAAAGPAGGAERSPPAAPSAEAAAAGPPAGAAGLAPALAVARAWAAEVGVGRGRGGGGAVSCGGRAEAAAALPPVEALAAVDQRGLEAAPAGAGRSLGESAGQGAAALEIRGFEELFNLC